LSIGRRYRKSAFHADKARDRENDEIVALKKVRFDNAKDGVPVTSIRELRVLQSVNHPNIVRLKKVVTGTKADR
jgi:serine/threonine protein kinase